MIFTRSVGVPERNERGLSFALSTPGRKRDGLSLDVGSFRIDNFVRNPVMLWQHGADPSRGWAPIGRWERVTVEPDAVRAVAVFDQEDDFARLVESKFVRGFLNAVSVGWLPIENADGGVSGFDLLEASAVAVPADPDALAEGRASVPGGTNDRLLMLEGTVQALRDELRAWRVRAALAGAVTRTQ